MVQPSNRRFVMEDRLNTEIATINSELDLKADLTASQTFTGTQTIVPADAAARALVVQGAIGQTENLQVWQNSSASVVGSITNGGTLTVSGGFATTSGSLRVGATSVLAKATVATGSATTIGAVIRGAASQTANLMEWQDSAGAVLGNVTSGGSMNITGNFTAGAASGVGSRFYVSNGSAATVAAIIRGAPSQSTDLQQWQNGSGSVLTWIQANGTLLSYAAIRSNGVLGAGTVTTTLGQITSISDSATRIGAVVRGAASQSANLQEWQNSAGSALAYVTAGGTIAADVGALNKVQLNTAYAGGSTAPGMLAWNDTDGTIEFQLKGGNVTLQIGQEQVVRIRNNTGSTLLNGKAVYISGSDGSNLRATYANASSESTSNGTIGITTEDITNGSAGYITTFGLVRNIDTTGLTEGAPVWLSTTDGGLTSARPVAPNHGVMVGFCLRAHATLGAIFVRVDNGWELDELHNVLITSPSNGQALTYDSASGLWKNATPASTLNDLTDVTINSGTLSGGQVIKYDAGTTQWVNGAAAGGVTASATAPSLSTSAAGDAWFDTNDGTLYVCYVDPDSTKQWVQVQANSALEGTILARLSSLEGQAIAFGNLSPNFVINAGFDIWQRGTSSTTNSTYIADRWLHSRSAGTHTVSRSTDVPASQGFQYSLSFASINGTNPTITQRIESANSIYFAGQSVTISVWAKSTTGTAGLSWSTAYPNAADDWTGQTTDKSGAFTASMTVGSWTRYSATFTVDALASRGYGISIFRPVTATSTTTIYTGVQLEVGSVVTSFRRNASSIQAELAACQRYYYRQDCSGSNGAYQWFVSGGSSSAAVFAAFTFPVEMRTLPTMSSSAGSTFAGIPSGTVTSVTSATDGSNKKTYGVFFNGSGFAAGTTIRANNNTSAYIDFSAEL